MSTRRLRDAAAPQVAIVETVEELMKAVGTGVANIQIRQHLDLRVDDPVPDEFEQLQPILDWIPPTVSSIRVGEHMHA